MAPAAGDDGRLEHAPAQRALAPLAAGEVIAERGRRVAGQLAIEERIEIVAAHGQESSGSSPKRFTSTSRSFLRARFKRVPTVTRWIASFAAISS